MSYRTDRSLDSLALGSCLQARQLILDAERLCTKHERTNRQRFARLCQNIQTELVTCWPLRAVGVCPLCVVAF